MQAGLYGQADRAARQRCKDLVATALVWLVVVTLAPEANDAAALLRDFVLQTTLGNLFLFAGLSLELERPVRIGDNLRKVPHEGRIEALKWRSIHLRTSNGSPVVLPTARSRPRRWR